MLQIKSVAEDFGYNYLHLLLIYVQLYQGGYVILRFCLFINKI